MLIVWNHHSLFARAKVSYLPSLSSKALLGRSTFSIVFVMVFSSQHVSFEVGLIAPNLATPASLVAVNLRIWLRTGIHSGSKHTELIRIL